MRSLWKQMLRGFIILAALSLAACGASSTGNTTGGTPAPTAQPTAKAKPKPISPPQVTQQFCQSIMSVADANQIMNPPTPITTVTAQSDSELGVCHYTSPQVQLDIVKILVEEKPYTGPNPVPEATIVQLMTQLANEPGVTITMKQPVTGVGDQAEFLAANVSNAQLTLYADALYVIYGQVAFMCDDFHLNTRPDDASQKSGLQQCAQRVVNVL